MNNKFKPQQILEKVGKLTYADISCYELLSFGNEAYSSIAGNESNARLKARVQQIRDQQIRPLFSEELLVEERRVMFADAKENLTLFLKDYLATGKICSNNSE
jgi:hypothetical protein